MRARLFRWSIITLAGVAGGLALGEVATGSRSGSGRGEPASFSRLSANPAALMPQGKGASPCPDCPDSYGVAARLRAHREDRAGDDRMSDEFRELGAVDLDAPTRTYADDDYRYGGRFPDPPPVVADRNPAPTTKGDWPSLGDNAADLPPEY
jgi:hypothetical protein